MGDILGKAARTSRNSYVRVLLSDHREEIRTSMERLRKLRKARGEVLYINNKLDGEIASLLSDIESKWDSYREASLYLDMVETE